MIRSIVVHDIPADAVAAMERWYHRVHAAEIVRRYGPWLARHESFVPVPPPPETVQHEWHRLSELWFDSLSDWSAAVAQGAALTPPPWATRPAYPFVESGRDFVSSFLLERPTDDFLRDLRSYLP